MNNKCIEQEYKATLKAIDLIHKTIALLLPTCIDENDHAFNEIRLSLVDQLGALRHHQDKLYTANQEYLRNAIPPVFDMCATMSSN